MISALILHHDFCTYILSLNLHCVAQNTYVTLAKLQCTLFMKCNDIREILKMAINRIDALQGYTLVIHMLSLSTIHMLSLSKLQCTLWQN